MDELPQFNTKTFISILLNVFIPLIYSGGLIYCDRYQIDDITDRTTSGQVVDRSGHPLKYRTYSFDTGDTLY